ncbi:uncharacterized protein LOC113239381 [Hyposmocoma kahamanoa]|uniref:uncharacterized protein LOC113239381 n=1 Tax=Hyposmocoma kahamanoa TaxID=1477025 RepID=UPI000E6D6ECF|nr:uncharacterized protein LOC113239381 [Hyposmocoma kahamanoa]
MVGGKQHSRGTDPGTVDQRPRPNKWTLTDERDLCAVKLLADTATGLPEVVLASVYMAETDVPPPQKMERLIKYCEQSGQHIVVATDSNAHHPLWGMELANDRGKNLIEYLFTTNLQILNKGTVPTFVNKRCRTIIDLTLASEGAVNLVQDLHVSEEASFSDHRWIRFNLETTIKEQQPKRNPRKTDRKIYIDKLHQSLGEPVAPGRLLDTAQIETQVTELTSNILSSYNSACPLSESAPRQGQHWWGPELERLRRRYVNIKSRAVGARQAELYTTRTNAGSRTRELNVGGDLSLAHAAVRMRSECIMARGWLRAQISSL